MTLREAKTGSVVRFRDELLTACATVIGGERWVRVMDGDRKGAIDFLPESTVVELVREHSARATQGGEVDPLRQDWKGLIP